MHLIERGYRQSNTFWDYNGGTYYLGSDGKAYTSGVYKINGKLYCFASYGRCYQEYRKNSRKQYVLF